MYSDKAMRETRQGMQNVQREIIDQVQARKVSITADNFSWNHGREFVGFPSSVYMEVRVESRQAVKDWPRDWLADSWDRIDRWEARQEIERIVDELTDATA